MKWKKYRENMEIVFGIGFIIAAAVGWGYFIYSLCAGLGPWEKTGTVLGSYVVVFVFCKVLSNPGAGAIPVRVVYIERDANER